MSASSGWGPNARKSIDMRFSARKSRRRDRATRPHRGKGRGIEARGPDDKRRVHAGQPQRHAMLANAALPAPRVDRAALRRIAMLYFAYGSNLDPEQMSARCPSHRVIGLAELKEHRLVFPLFSPRWGGG